MTGRDARPLGLPATGRAAQTASVASTRQQDSTTTAGPVAVEVFKPGRGSAANGWCVVAVLTRFLNDDELILRTTWREQHGTDKAISLPVSVLNYAEAAGVQRFYLRDDRPGRRRMWTCGLSTFRRGGLRADGERYIPLDWLQEVAWRDWLYATETKRLDAADNRHNERQLTLL